MSTTFIEKPRYSCALGGALITVNALPRTVPVLHASLGCGGMTSAAFNMGSGYLGSGYSGGNSIPVSGITEKEIVFGGAERLEEQLKNTAEIIDADLFIVISGCTAEIIGDDVASVVQDYNTKREQNPLALFVSGAGFKGDSYWGYDSVLQTIIRDYVDPDVTQKKGYVNLWGIPPGQDVFWEGNIVEIRRLLEKLGLKVNSFFTYDDTLDGIRNAGQAEYNIILSNVNGLAAAETFKEVHSTPFIQSQLPIGAKATNRFLRLIGEKLTIDNRIVDAVVEEETNKYYHYAHRLTDAYSDIDLQRYCAVIGDNNYAISLTEFVMNEFGWIPKLVVVTDQLDDERKHIIEDVFKKNSDIQENVLAFESDTSLIATSFAARWQQSDGTRYYQAFSPSFVLGSRLDKDFADAIGAGHLSVSYPVSNKVVLNRGYSGYHGALHLIEDIYSTILAAR